MAPFVDDRPIECIDPDELRDHTRCHFFAGIGGWELALRWAGWPEDRPAWTGSCPCQPFSAAGKQRGTGDARHLWPVWKDLIAECLPPTIFGEQVASKAGREWLSGVRDDLEALGYAVGAADLCAAGVGAPHIRQRLYWVASRPPNTSVPASQRISGGLHSSQGRVDGPGIGLDGSMRQRHSDGEFVPCGPRDSEQSGWEGFDIATYREPTKSGGRVEKRRRIEPGTLPLAHGVPSRVVRIRGYGNAIVPHLAAQFVASFLEAEQEGKTE